MKLNWLCEIFEDYILEYFKICISADARKVMSVRVAYYARWKTINNVLLKVINWS